MRVPSAFEAMVIRFCGAILGRAGGVRIFSSSTIRGASSGPIRYNPGSAKPSRRDTKEEEDARVSHSRPLPKWKRAPKTDKEWGLRKKEEQKRYWDEQDSDTTGDASSEMERLKTEMKLRDASTQAPPSSSHKRENIPLQEAVPAIPVVPKHQTFGSSGLFHGDGRKFEGSSNSNRKLPKKNALQGSGLCYGDGRKFEGLLPDATPLIDEDMLFETVETEEDKTIAKEKQAAKNYALRLLGMAPQTAHKLRQKLIGRSVSAPVVESTIADLQRCGLQSDLEYAEAFARSRWRSALWGPQRLKQELRQRGVCAEDVATALEKVFTTTDPFHEEENEADESEALWGMTKEASAHLLEKARLQWARGGSISAEARKRRMIGWLQRRGFNWSITSQILKSLESEDKNKLVD